MGWSNNKNCVKEWDAYWKGGRPSNLTAFWRPEKYGDPKIPYTTFYTYVLRDKSKRLTLKPPKQRSLKKTSLDPIHLNEEERTLKRHCGNTHVIHWTRCQPPILSEQEDKKLARHLYLQYKVLKWVGFEDAKMSRDGLPQWKDPQRNWKMCLKTLKICKYAPPKIVEN